MVQLRQYILDDKLRNISKLSPLVLQTARMIYFLYKTIAQQYRTWTRLSYILCLIIILHLISGFNLFAN